MLPVFVMTGVGPLMSMTCTTGNVGSVEPCGFMRSESSLPGAYMMVGMVRVPRAARSGVVLLGRVYSSIVPSPRGSMLYIFPVLAIMKMSPLGVTQALG